MGPQPLAVGGGLLIQTAGALELAPEDWRGCHDTAPAALASDESEVGQAGEGLAHDAAGDAELPLQFFLGGQGRAGVEREVKDLPVQDVPDLGMQWRAAVPIQQRGALCGLRS
ncbi:hypothetical protein SAT01_31050 [Sinomonas atrocyanea]|nr:hypothetical protein SAT01_31050 [Sinomonas atrocyanea]GGG75445.1 hypothetical protein GCM10007172_30340 [Sinomonas atrocyanea]